MLLVRAVRDGVVVAVGVFAMVVVEVMRVVADGITWMRGGGATLNDARGGGCRCRRAGGCGS